LERELELEIAPGKVARLDIKKSPVGDLASAFIDEAVERVRGAAGAHQVGNVERLSEGFLQALDEGVSYCLAHLEPAQKDLLLEWLVTAIVGGYGQDFLRRFLGALLAPPKPGGDPGPAGEGG